MDRRSISSFSTAPSSLLHRACESAPEDRDHFSSSHFLFHSWSQILRSIPPQFSTTLVSLFPFFWLFELGRSLCFLSLSCVSPILSLGHSLKLRSHALVCFCCCHFPPPPQCHGWRHYPNAICGNIMSQSIPLPLVPMAVDCQSSSESVDHFQS